MRNRAGSSREPYGCGARSWDTSIGRVNSDGGDSARSHTLRQSTPRARSRRAASRAASWASCSLAVNAFRFLYHVTLGRDRTDFHVPAPKVPQRLPEILSRAEVWRLIDAARSPKHRLLLATTYAAGLRVSEVVALKVADIDPDRLTIRVEQGKGGKDRYVPLADRLLVGTPRATGRWCRPPAGSSPIGRARGPIDITVAQKIYMISQAPRRHPQAGRHPRPAPCLRHPLCWRRARSCTPSSVSSATATSPPPCATSTSVRGACSTRARPWICPSRPPRSAVGPAPAPPHAPSARPARAASSSPRSSAPTARRIGSTHRLSRAQRRAMRAIETCRTAALGGHRDVCDHCGAERLSYNSCRNRHCPKCQTPGHRALARGAPRRAAPRRVLPRRLHPAACPQRPLAQATPGSIYTLLFRAAAATLSTFAPRSPPSRRRARRAPRSCTPGGRTSPSTSTCTASSPAAPWPSTAPAGSRAAPAFSSPSAPSPRSSAASTSTPSDHAVGRRDRSPSPATRPLGRPDGLRRVARVAPPAGLGRLRQAPLRRPRAGARLPRPLHPPRRPLQRPPRRSRRTASSASAGRTTPTATASSSWPCAAEEFIRRFLLHVVPERLRPHPSLRPPRQPRPAGQAGALPAAPLLCPYLRPPRRRSPCPPSCSASPVSTSSVAAPAARAASPASRPSGRPAPPARRSCWPWIPPDARRHGRLRSCLLHSPRRRRLSGHLPTLRSSSPPRLHGPPPRARPPSLPCAGRPATPTSTACPSFPPAPH